MAAFGAAESLLQQEVKDLEIRLRYIEGKHVRMNEDHNILHRKDILERRNRLHETDEFQTGDDAPNDVGGSG